MGIGRRSGEKAAVHILLPNADAEGECARKLSLGFCLDSGMSLCGGIHGRIHFGRELWEFISEEVGCIIERRIKPPPAKAHNKAGDDRPLLSSKNRKENTMPKKSIVEKFTESKFASVTRRRREKWRKSPKIRGKLLFAGGATNSTRNTTGGKKRGKPPFE